MTNETARSLAADLSFVAKRRAQANSHRKAWGVTVEVRDDVAAGEPRICFLRYGTVEHSLSVGASDEARVWAHFNGFVGDRPDTLPRKGERVAFRRGMHGLWSGIVTHVGAHKATHKHAPGRVYFVLSFHKRNGAVGTYRCETFDLVAPFNARS
jgi:hypothetical protein